jgi:hypothetical protein
MARGQTLSARTVGHAIQTVTLIEAMLEKIAPVGSDRRPTERLPALGQPHMSSSSLSLSAATNSVRASAFAHVSANRDFFVRFLLDTHCASSCCSTRHSDTSRNGRKFSRCIKSATATRHLNATPSTRHSNAKFPPFSPSLFFPSAPVSGRSCLLCGLRELCWRCGISPRKRPSSKRASDSLLTA